MSGYHTALYHGRCESELDNIVIRQTEDTNNKIPIIVKSYMVMGRLLYDNFQINISIDKGIKFIANYQTSSNEILYYRFLFYE